jgi:hypothetical protein
LKPNADHNGCDKKKIVCIIHTYGIVIVAALMLRENPDDMCEYFSLHMNYVYMHLGLNAFVHLPKMLVADLAICPKC